VKARNGSVLSRGFILKTDHYPSGECFKLFWGNSFTGLFSVLAISDNPPAILYS
jgi:hypothetical protein